MDDMPRANEPIRQGQTVEPPPAECREDAPDPPATEDRTPEEAGYGYGV
jgi:hypothetical protein